MQYKCSCAQAPLLISCRKAIHACFIVAERGTTIIPVVAVFLACLLLNCGCSTTSLDNKGKGEKDLFIQFLGQPCPATANTYLSNFSALDGKYIKQARLDTGRLDTWRDAEIFWHNTVVFCYLMDNHPATVDIERILLLASTNKLGGIEGNPFMESRPSYFADDRDDALGPGFFRQYAFGNRFNIWDGHRWAKEKIAGDKIGTTMAELTKQGWPSAGLSFGSVKEPFGGESYSSAALLFFRALRAKALRDGLPKIVYWGRQDSAEILLPRLPGFTVEMAKLLSTRRTTNSWELQIGSYAYQLKSKAETTTERKVLVGISLKSATTNYIDVINQDSWRLERTGDVPDIDDYRGTIKVAVRRMSTLIDDNNTVIYPAIIYCLMAMQPDPESADKVRSDLLRLCPFNHNALTDYLRDYKHSDLPTGP